MNKSTWALAAIDDRGADIAVALLASGDIVPVDVLPAGMAPIDVLRRWDEFASELRSWTPDPAKKLEGVRLVAPVRYPAKLVCIGVNYFDHRQEMDSERDAEGKVGEVFMFLKPPTTAIVGPGEDVLIRGPDDKIDWEAEIGVVIGRGGRFIPQDEALDHIAGYTLANDISARGPFMPPNPCHPAVQYDWIAQKAQDTHCPIGPGVVPSWFIPDPDNIPFSLTVNGIEKQNGNTREFVHHTAKIIAAVSEYMTLEPGDIIATGTCGGVGFAKGEFMVDGDVVEINSPLIGTLTNNIREIRRPTGK